MPTLGELHTNVKWAESLKEVRNELERWGIKDFVLPTWDVAHKQHKVSLQIAVNGVWMPIECGRFPSPEQNIRAILQVVEATRKAYQRGIVLTLLQAVKILALPSGERDPCEILGVPLGTTDRGELLRAYRQKVLVTHPDAGGDPKEFMAVHAAGEKLGLI